MEGPKTKAVVASGIVPDSDLMQLQRWRLLPDELHIPQEGLPQGEVLASIRSALDSAEAVEIRATDLDALKEYLARKQRGRLHIQPDLKDRPSSISVDYARLASGNYIIPWVDDNISDLMLAPETYLKPVGVSRVYFADVDELYFGENKAFMICTPAKEPQ